jgi:hypothetical protein
MRADYAGVLDTLLRGRYMPQYLARLSAGLGARLVRVLAGAALLTMSTALVQPTRSLAAGSSVPSGLVVVIEDKPQ